MASDEEMLLATVDETLPEQPTPEVVLEGDDEGEFEVSGSVGARIEKNDRSLSELKRWFDEGRLILDPDWQRNSVWDRKRNSRLIESILLEIPVPVIYLAKQSNNSYLVIDGLQRLTAVFKFFNDEYQLFGTEVKKELEKRTYRKLEQGLQRQLQDATFRCFEL